jgi:hypothetical protein
MSALNFLNKKFMSISLDGNVNQVVNEKNNKKEKKNENKRFSHGSGVLLKRGYYKGYKGIITEYYPERIDIEFDCSDYVFAKNYGVVENGMFINTVFGNSMVVNKIPELFVMKWDEEELRLPKEYIMRLVYITENENPQMGVVDNETGVVKILKLTEKELELMLLELSKIIKENKLAKLLNASQEVIACIDCMNYCIVIRNSENSNDNKYLGKFGKCMGVIDEQYMIKYKKVVKLEKKYVEIKEAKAYVKKGLYKNTVGDVIKIHKASLNINIEALNKNFTKHVLYENNMFTERKIEVDDVFYNDVMLNDGSCIEVKKIVGDNLFGFNMTVKEIVRFNKSDIKMYLPGFKIENDDSDIIDGQDQGNDKEDDIFIHTGDEEEQEENVDVDDKDINDRTEYECGDVNEKEDIEENANSGLVFEEPAEMKESYKDSERSAYMTRKFSKVEMEILNSIDKIVRMLNYPEDSVNKYNLLEKVMESSKVMKDDLERIQINKWKTSDMKYIVSCLVIYEIIKVAMVDVKYSFFTKQIEALYKIGFFTKGDIMGSTFLRIENEKDIKNTCFGLILLSTKDCENVKKLYKETRYLEVIFKMMENCGMILQKWFGKINFNENNAAIEILSVASKGSKKEYPKYFLTTSDIVSGNIPETAKKVLWGPQSKYLVDIWKNSLRKKLESCDDINRKCVYKYVIDNFDNAPFMRKMVANDDLEKMKYKELMRTFVKFIEQLKEYTNMKNSEKSMELQKRNEESERINKKRGEINAMNGMNIDLDNLDIGGKPKRTRYF